ncbi:hypothetical protein AA106556_0378 [Neokomagataea tanensis NBRC 106556]|uniref:ASCH domain-containing protein n=2 Tax=Acetobacteraceae TaxID=433 RepID=A0ABQ0QGV0_9PROT|nr:hypothetical protein AA106556_0378 [Neokomagataea tanensis NBRC 106556]
MTSVYIRAYFDSLVSGQRLKITLKGQETYRNISDMIKIIPCKIIQEFELEGAGDIFSGIIMK